MALDLNDKSPSGYNLTNHGATEYTTTHPFVASTEAVDTSVASSQYLDAALSGGLSLTNVTVEAWVRLRSNSAFQVVVGKDDDIAGRAFALAFNNANKFYFEINGNDPSANTLNNTALSLDTWTHIAAVFNDSAQTAIYYLNGVADGGGSYAATHIPANTALINVGRRSYSGGNEGYFDGQITEVRVWNTVRTAVQIANNYNVQLTGSETGLVTYYPFQELPVISGSSDLNLMLTGIGD